MAYPSFPNEEPFLHFLFPFHFQFHFSQFLQKPLSPSLLTRYLSPTTPFHGASLFSLIFIRTHERFGFGGVFNCGSLSGFVWFQVTACR